MKIDWSFVLIVICGIGANVSIWCADLFLDDMQIFVDLKVGSAFCLIAMLFVLFNSFNNKRRKEIAELRREIDAQKVEKQENP